LNPVEDIKEIEMVVLTKNEYSDIIKRFDRLEHRLTVTNKLVEMNLKSSGLRSGKIYRTEMIGVYGRRTIDNAIRDGHLRVNKNDPSKRNSKVYAKRGEWERFKNWNVNKKI